MNAAAAAAGAAPGQSLSEARALCPELRSRPQDPAAERAALARLAAWCGRYTPWVALDSAAEPGGAAGLWLDITGCAHLCGGEAALSEELLARLRRFGLSARLGLADTPGAAWALARYATEAARPACRVAPEGQRAALAPLPVAALRLSAERAELLRRLGLSRIGDLLALPPAALEPRVGPEVTRRLRQALGGLAEPISPRSPVPPQHARLAFGEPIGAPEDLARAVESLLGRLCAGLERAALGGRRFTLTGYRVDGSLARLAVGTARPVRDPAHLKRLFAGRLEGLDPGFGIEALQLAAETVEPLSALQLSLGAAADRPPRGPVSAGRGPERPPAGPASDARPAEPLDLGRLVDRLGDALGFARVHRLLPRESHLPERCVAPGPALPHRDVAGSVRQGRWPARYWPAGPPRPLRLLPRPEPVEVTTPAPDASAPDAPVPDAPVPDAPAPDAAAPDAAAVSGPAASAPAAPPLVPPARFRWRRLSHRVVRAEGPERLSPEWWLPRDAADRGPRDYYRVEDADGRRYWLFRERGRWFLHGVFA